MFHLDVFSTCCQSQGNVNRGMADEDDPLTERGRKQAEHLGKDWKDVHIDVLYSSTLQRAHDTALQISTQNHACPEVEKSPLFVERKMGQAVIEWALAGNLERAGE